MGDINATITLSSEYRAIGIDVYGNGGVSANNVGGSIYIAQTQNVWGPYGMDLASLSAQNVSTAITLSGGGGDTMGVLLRTSASFQTFSGTITAVNNEGIAVGLQSQLNSNLGYIDAAANIDLTCAIGAGIVLNHIDNPGVASAFMGPLAGKIKITSNGVLGDNSVVAGIFTNVDNGSTPTGTIATTVDLVNGAQIIAVQQLDSELAFVAGNNNAGLITIRGQSATDNFKMVGGLVGAGGTLIENGVYNWSNLHTVESGRALAIGFISTEVTNITIASTATVILEDNAVFKESVVDVAGKLVLTADTVDSFSSVTLDRGASVEGDGAITLRLDNLFSATDGQTMQLFELTDGVLDAQLGGTLTLVYEDGRVVKVSDYSFDYSTGVLTFHADIPEPAAAAALLGLLAMALVARRK